MKIPITRNVFDESEAKAIIEPLKSGWLVQGPNVAEFENQFKQYVGCQYAKAVSSCTTALHLAIDALGIGPGDKVIVPSFTYIASANAVETTGAEVVFCDIDLRTFNIDIQQCEQLLEQDKAIKAIMPIDLFGLSADMRALVPMAKKYNVKIISDSACGFGAYLDGRHAGTYADVACFSFHPRKTITTGEGGMVITNDETLYAVMSQLCDHGASKSDFQRHTEKGGSRLPDFTRRGFNYRMTDFQGALGVCQMHKAAEIVAGRRKVALQYDAALAGVHALLTPVVPDGYVHGYQSYVCLFMMGHNIEDLNIELIDQINYYRNVFMDKLEEKGIATRQGTHAVHTLGFYKDKYKLNHGDFIKAYAADRLSITLPLYAGMTDEEFNYVIEQMKAHIPEEVVA